MSRIGKRPINIPKDVSVELSGGRIAVKGPKGKLAQGIPPAVDVKVDGNEVWVSRNRNDREGRAMHGLARGLIQNMITGVSKGFVRVLEVIGVGYRAEVKGKLLSLSVGYSHPIEVVLPEGVQAKVDKNFIEISGIDKAVVGELAAAVRKQRPPEPYKGKGIKYVEERIRRKVGKAGVA
ncbi:MAG: 50S ribosomal protein L6 [Pseudomonadota bacterium]